MGFYSIIEGWLGIQLWNMIVDCETTLFLLLFPHSTLALTRRSGDLLNMLQGDCASTQESNLLRLFSDCVSTAGVIYHQTRREGDRDE
jgi:hypothetical protein